MVYFICEGCNETLKKNQVAKHLLKCYQSSKLVCMDCNVSFTNYSYSSHTICITEDEKYMKGLYQKKVLYFFDFYSFFNSFFLFRIQKLIHKNYGNLQS